MIFFFCKKSCIFFILKDKMEDKTKAVTDKPQDTPSGIEQEGKAVQSEPQYILVYINPFTSRAFNSQRIKENGHYKQFSCHRLANVYSARLKGLFYLLKIFKSR